MEANKIFEVDYETQGTDNTYVSGDTLYVISKTYEDALKKANKYIESTLKRDENKPIVSKDGSLNIDKEEIVIKILSIRILSDNII